MEAHENQNQVPESSEHKPQLQSSLSQLEKI